MEAIILAGGKGTRLQSVVNDVPKPMANINGKPFLAYLIHSLSTKGVTKIILSVGYKHDAIMDYFLDCYDGISINYAIEDELIFNGIINRYTIITIQKIIHYRIMFVPY